jgi:hypothetical protein
MAPTIRFRKSIMGTSPQCELIGTENNSFMVIEVTPAAQPMGGA